MPYGLPGLDEREFATIQRWIAAGAPYEGDPPLSPAVQEQIRSWETFLNGESNKERLMSRYLYEHLYLGTLYFESDAQRRPLRLIRSAAAPGKPAVPIATRRAYDDPGVARVYYRLVPERETIVAKTHMPYQLGAARMAKYRAWFLDPAYTVTVLPSYDAETASNPFAAFHDLPLDGRYRFMLDEAEYFVMNFIKGPVCRGQLALDVIEDRFWVFFVDPRGRRRCHGRRTPRARTPQPAPTRRMGQQLASADPMARVLEARSKLPAGEKRVARAQRSGAQG